MPVRLLFVCLGNICRSPAAEAVFQHLAEEAGLASRFTVDSAGTGGWHVGDQADRRMRAAASARGIAVTSRARQVAADDFERFDHIFAMDADNLRALRALAPPAGAHKLRLFRDLDPEAPGEDVPDPYTGGPEDFDEVLDIVTRTGRALLAELTARRDA
ncbi:MAG: low molecular weight protein-tyrosine-phosphatase [Vicinamibacterales bacterium]|nr:low molecular weight protein-tyrosine-phosphatase [Vicinamibacterales bacterium]